MHRAYVLMTVKFITYKDKTYIKNLKRIKCTVKFQRGQNPTSLAQLRPLEREVSAAPELTVILRFTSKTNHSFANTLSSRGLPANLLAMVTDCLPWQHMVHIHSVKLQRQMIMK